MSSHDVERIVFVGGPAQYKNLRDKVAFELGIAPSTDVNPMTAVASGGVCRIHRLGVAKPWPQERPWRTQRWWRT